MSKALYLKSTFWSRLPAYHRALYGGLFRGAMRSPKLTDGADTDINRIFQEKQFTYAQDTFHQYSYWLEAFRNWRQPIRRILEVGCFEGRSTVFMAWLFPEAEITCIDPFLTKPGLTGIAPSEEKFLRNTVEHQDRINLIKGLSYIELPKLITEKRQFDLIYIDGSHAYSDVLIDSLMGWQLLDLGGVIIWDDYLFQPKHYGKLGPKLAIDQFLTAHRGLYEVVFAWKQVAIRRSQAGESTRPAMSSASQAS